MIWLNMNCFRWKNTLWLKFSMLLQWRHLPTRKHFRWQRTFNRKDRYPFPRIRLRHQSCSKSMAKTEKKSKKSRNKTTKLCGRKLKNRRAPSRRANRPRNLPYWNRWWPNTAVTTGLRRTDEGGNQPIWVSTFRIVDYVAPFARL